jgi:hypothetical protein
LRNSGEIIPAKDRCVIEDNNRLFKIIRRWCEFQMRVSKAFDAKCGFKCDIFTGENQHRLESRM